MEEKNTITIGELNQKLTSVFNEMVKDDELPWLGSTLRRMARESARRYWEASDGRERAPAGIGKQATGAVERLSSHTGFRKDRRAI